MFSPPKKEIERKTIYQHHHIGSEETRIKTIILTQTLKPPWFYITLRPPTPDPKKKKPPPRQAVSQRVQTALSVRHDTHTYGQRPPVHPFSVFANHGNQYPAWTTDFCSHRCGHRPVLLYVCCLWNSVFVCLPFTLQQHHHHQACPDNKILYYYSKLSC